MFVFMVTGQREERARSARRRLIIVGVNGEDQPALGGLSHSDIPPAPSLACLEFRCGSASRLDAMSSHLASKTPDSSGRDSFRLEG